ncbi:MAG: hypothetical protein V1798_04700 [Pseudomonadota bacterium]
MSATQKPLILLTASAVVAGFVGCIGHNAPRYGTVPAHSRKIGVTAVGTVPAGWPDMTAGSLRELYACQVGVLENSKESPYPVPSGALLQAGVLNFDQVLVLRAGKTDPLNPMPSVTVSLFSLNPLRSEFEFPLQVTSEPDHYLKLSLGQSLKDPGRLPRGSRAPVAAELERRGELEMARDVLEAARDDYKTTFVHDIAERSELEQKLVDLDRRIEAGKCVSGTTHGKPTN